MFVCAARCLGGKGEDKRMQCENFAEQADGSWLELRRQRQAPTLMLHLTDTMDVPTTDGVGVVMLRRGWKERLDLKKK